MNVLERAARAVGLSGRLPAPISDANPLTRVRSQYMLGNMGNIFGRWRPALREQHDEIASVWDTAAARTFDTIQNSGWINGMVEQGVANTVGTGLRLKLTPDFQSLGWTASESSKWAERVESRFDMWANSAYDFDIEGRLTFGLAQARLLRSYFATGEIWSERVRRARTGSPWLTKIRMISPTRMSHKTDDLARIFQGVEMNRDGLPIAYWPRHKRMHMGWDTEYRVSARDGFGMPRVHHGYDGFVGQIRGISPLVPALRVARQFDQLADATLMAAIIQSVFAAVIKSDLPTDEFVQSLLTPQEMGELVSQGNSPFDAWFEAQSGWYDTTSIDVGINGRLAHLFPGQELEFKGASHPSKDYKDFSLHLLRELARCFGVTYESATGDYEGATYSSVRMAVNEIFAITLYRRAFLIAPFCQFAFENWLEEDIAAGNTPFPGGINGFRDNRRAACRARWRGAPKPQADDLKTAKAHQIWRDMGVMTDDMIAADLGVDIEDVYAARAREMEMREELGLPEPVAAGVMMTDQDPEDDEPEPVVGGKKK